MSIQAQLNQTLSLAGLLYSQTPMAEAQREKIREKAATEAKQKEVNKAIDAYERFAEHGAEIAEVTEDWAEKRAAAGITTSPEQKKERAEAEQKGQLFIQERGENAYRSKFEMDPTGENYEAYVRAMADRPNITQQGKEYISQLDKQIQTRQKAADALAAEQARIAASNSLDLSKLDERARPRVERAYKRAERDTKYLTKKEDAK